MLKKSAFILVLLLAAYLFLFSHLFKIQGVSLNKSSACATPQQIFKDTQLEGKSIFTVSTAQVEADIRSKYPCAEVVEAKKKYPKTIEVEITQKDVVVQIEGSDLFLTEDAFVVRLQTEKKYPNIFLPDKIQPQENKKIEDDKVKYATRLIKNLAKTDFTSAQIRFVESTVIVVYSQAEASAIFSTQRDLDSQVDSLQSVLSKAKIDPSKIEKIDLRFDNPVVSYKK